MHVLAAWAWSIGLAFCAERHDLGVGTSAVKELRITGNYTDCDTANNTLTATGNVEVVIGGQNSKLTADKVVFEQTNKTVAAHGNVRILRLGLLTTGTDFKFRIGSDEYLVTESNVRVSNPHLICRLRPAPHLVTSPLH